MRFLTKNKKAALSVFAPGFHPLMLKVLSWMFDELNDASLYVSGISELVFTCGYRPGDKGVHGTLPTRGLDITSWKFEEPKKIEDRINAAWIYDPDRPEMKVAWVHDAGSGQHLHIQVHPNTVRRGSEINVYKQP